jgi:hypothetical protein
VIKVEMATRAALIDGAAATRTGLGVLILISLLGFNNVGKSPRFGQIAQTSGE